MNGYPPGSRQLGLGQQKSRVGNFSNTGGKSMARQVTCVCGRDFHIGHSQTRVQCRQSVTRQALLRDLSGLRLIGRVLPSRCDGRAF